MRHDRCTLSRIHTDATLLSKSRVLEIEDAIRRLTREDLTRFRDWFFEFDAEAWDRQFERDAEAGRLDALAEKAVEVVRWKSS